MSDAAPHRDWLHALEDDLSVPDYALQVARIFSDFAAKSGPVHVAWRMLRRCTHQHNDKLAKSLAWLRSHGWLQELPAINGARKYHRLTTPDARSGQDQLLTIRTTPDGRSRTTPDGRSGTTPDGRRLTSTSVTTRNQRSARFLANTAARSARAAG